MVMIIVLLLGVLCIGYGVATGNRFKRLHIKIQEAQADIEVALIKRYDVLMQSLDAIKGYTEHEEETACPQRRRRRFLTIRSRCFGM